MSYTVPSLELLRQQAAGQGVTPTDEDLERVLAFLEVLLPKLGELERVVPPGLAPAELR